MQNWGYNFSLVWRGKVEGRNVEGDTPRWAKRNPCHSPVFNTEEVAHCFMGRSQPVNSQDTCAGKEPPTICHSLLPSGTPHGALVRRTKPQTKTTASHMVSKRRSLGQMQQYAAVHGYRELSKRPARCLAASSSPFAGNGRICDWRLKGCLKSCHAVISIYSERCYELEGTLPDM